MSNKLLVRAGTILALLLALVTGFAVHSSAAGFALHPSLANAAAEATPPPSIVCGNTSTTECSISHYVNFDGYNTTVSMVENWAYYDAKHIDPGGDGADCNDNYYSNDVVAILDFGSLNEWSGNYGESDWYKQDTGSPYYFLPFYDIYPIAEDYATTYYSDAGVCTHLDIVIGTNNSYECGFLDENGTCVIDAAAAMDGAVNTAQDYLNSLGGDYPVQMHMALGDDIEYDNSTRWDTYNLTGAAVAEFAVYPIGYTMFDYGFTIPLCGSYQKGSACGSGGVDSNGNPIWDYGEMYNVAWGIGNDIPLEQNYPENSEGSNWNAVYNNTKNGCYDCDSAGPISFWGVMTQDGWNDPDDYYNNFMSSAGGAAPAYRYDTCMPSTYVNDPTTPCYSES